MDLDALWYGTGIAATVTRGALAPLEAGYRGVVHVRNALFDAGWLRAQAPALPVVAIGNLTVGGTGKTPVSAFVAARLRALGGSPAVVMRGYGDDEPAVHRILNPDVPVLTSADRVAGIRAARAAGCDVAVLDDAFKHRWVQRTENLVLVSVEQWANGSRRCLPTGPYREPLSALRRASLVLVTRKDAGEEEAVALQAVLRRETPAVVGRVAIHPDTLRRADGSGATEPLSRLYGARVLAITAIGAPAAFARQLEQLGAQVTLTAYPDHHRFSPADVRNMIARAAGTELVVCTLKDAVKLTSLWPPRGQSLWYVSQRLEVEAGAPELDEALRRLLRRRGSRSDVS
ncbi:MAG: tetraacyldisaccharide 4'-kinase [Gemmatimonadaceae bacterium]